MYIVWLKSGLGFCKFCRSDNLVPEGESSSRYKQRTVVKITSNPTAITENVKRVNCLDFREFIRFDARKCKHCGSYVEPQK